MHTIDQPSVIARPLVAGISMVSLLATVVNAQTETDTPEQREQQWSLFVAFQETDGGTLGFAAINDEGASNTGGSVTDSVTTRLTFGSLSNRSNLVFDGWVSANALERDFSSSWPSFGGAFSWSYGGPYLGTSFSLAASSGLESGSLVSIGVFPARFDSWRIETSGGLSYRVTPYTSISMEFAYDRTGFDNPNPLESSLIVLEQPPFEEDLSEVLPDPPAGPEEEQEVQFPEAPDAQTFILDVIAAEGLAYTNLSSDSYSASFGISHRASARTRLSVGFFGGHRNFQTLGPDIGLTSGLNYGVSGSLSHLLTERDSLFLLYRLRQNSAQIPAVLQQDLTLGWGRALRQGLPHLDLHAQGGVGYLRALDVAFDDVVPVADIGLSAQLTRSTAASVSAHAGHNETLGFGRSLRTRFLAFDVSQMITSRAQVAVAGGYAVGNNLVDQAIGSEGGRFGARFYWEIFRGCRLETTYQRVGRQRRSQETTSEDGTLLTIGLSYGRSWPRTLN